MKVRISGCILAFSPTASTSYTLARLRTLGYLSFTYVPLLLTATRRIPPRIEPVTFAIGSPLSFWLTFAILTIIGIAATRAAFFDKSWSFNVDEGGGNALVGISGYQTVAAEFLAVLSVVLFVVLRRTSIAFVALSAFVAARMYIGEGRASFLAAVFGMIVVIMIRKGIRIMRIRYLVALILIAVIFDWIGANRLALKEILFPDQVAASDEMRWENSDAYLQWTSDRRSAPLSDMFDFSSFTMVSKVVPNLTGFNWGSQYLQCLIWPIPRQIWPNKPVLTGRIKFPDVGNFYGQTISSMGDAYTNFGIMSLVLFMVALGACLCKLYQAVC